MGKDHNVHPEGRTSEHEYEAPRVTDKRGQKKERVIPSADQMPTAEELLNAASETEFEKQQREERERLAEWEALSDEEKQAILAQQAAEAESTPFAGGGIQTGGETAKEVLTSFAVVIDLDGTATAMPMALYEQQGYILQRDVTPRMMYRSAAEIMMDIEVAETSHTTLQMMKAVSENAAAAARAQALHAAAQRQGIRPRS